jgi:hypothetical protein
MKEAGKALRKLPHCPDLPGTWQNSQPGGAGSATEAEPFREPTDAMRSTQRPSQRGICPGGGACPFQCQLLDAAGLAADLVSADSMFALMAGHRCGAVTEGVPLRSRRFRE